MAWQLVDIVIQRAAVYIVQSDGVKVIVITQVAIALIIRSEGLLPAAGTASDYPDTVI